MKLVIKILLPVVFFVGAVVWFVHSLTPTAVVAMVERGDAVRAVPGSVEVLAAQVMDVKGEGQGRVLSSILEVGAEVEAGELLVQLDSGDLDIELERALFELKAAEDNLTLGSKHRFSLENAKEKLADHRRKFENGSVSSSIVEAHERALSRIEDTMAREKTSEELRINQMKNRIQILEREIAQRKIIAPVSGTVTAVHAFEGDLIGESQTVGRMISRNRDVAVKIGEENFAGLEVGQPARVKFLGYGNAIYDATVLKVLPVADATTRRYTVHLDVEIAEEKLFPGLTGEARITIDERAGSLVLPLVALEGNSRVLKVEGKTVRVAPVVTGYRNLASVEILQGLEEGDLVVVENLELFKDGDKVRVKRL